MSILGAIHSFRKPPPHREPNRQFEALLTSLFLMAWFVEARDPYTGGHLWRVSRYSQLLARKAGLSALETACAGIGGFLHDLGKVGVPDAILRKPDRLSDEEYEIMKTHPAIGARMLAAHPLSSLVRDAVQLHHERPDGKGYPFGLAGADIPLIARIVGISDAYDAMTSFRPYRAGMSQGKALKILQEHSGTQFDPIWVDHMLTLGAAGDLQHIQNHSDEGIQLQECPMCGPTLVVRQENLSGDTIYCRNCGGGFTLIASRDNQDEQRTDKQLTAIPNGNRGNAIDLEAFADEALIARSIRQSMDLLPIEDLMRSMQ